MLKPKSNATEDPGFFDGRYLIEIEAWVKNRSRTTGYVEAEWRLPNGKVAVKVIAWKAIRPREAFERKD